MEPGKVASLSSDCTANEVVAQNDGQQQKCWFVMRDLKRPNTKLPAYKQLSKEEIEVFTPMKWQLIVCKGKRIRTEVPLIQDLLFVHSTRERLDPIVTKTATLQYRYLRGGGYREPLIVKEKDMERFMNAVRTADKPIYYQPGELTPSMYGKRIRIIGGPLNNFEGYLLSVRGSRVKRLLVDLPNLLTVGVEVNPEYIQFIKE